MAKKNGMDWAAIFAQLLPAIQAIIDALSKKKGVQASVAKMAPALKAASECGPEDCCGCLLACAAKILGDAVYFHDRVSNDPDATQEDRDRAECLLDCAARSVQYAVRLHQSCHPESQPEPAA